MDAENAITKVSVIGVCIILAFMAGSLIVPWVVESGILWPIGFAVFIIWAVLGSLTSIGSLFRR